jgi:DNA-binding SARP family transcriptional activator
MFHLQTFGGCIVKQDGAPLDALSGQRKVLALMATLAASGEYGISRDVLLSYLWPESSEPRARSSLNQLIHAVRQQLRTPDLLIGSSVLRLNPERITSDTSQFRDAMKGAIMRRPSPCTSALSSTAFTCVGPTSSSYGSRIHAPSSRAALLVHSRRSRRRRHRGESLVLP